MISLMTTKNTKPTLKIKFTEDIKLMVVDYSWGEEYMMIIKKGDVKEVDWIEHNRHGYKNICFT